MKQNRIFIKRFLLVILGFVMIAFQSPVFVSAHNHLAKTVRVGYYENEIFQEGASEDAVKSGYAYEYYMKLSEYTGWRYEYVYGSYNDLYQMLVDGDIDILAGIAYREDREELISYPELPMGTEAYVLVKHDFDTDITTNPSTLNGHTIGVLNSNMSITLQNYLEEHNIDAKIIIFENTAKLLDSFDSDAIDILAAESDGTNVRKHAEVLFAYGTADYFVCINKDDTILLSELNEAQNAMFTDEPYYLSMLNAKYFGSSLSSQTLSTVERNWLEKHDKIIVGYLNHYLPYSDTDVNGLATGVVKDIIPKLFDSLNITDLEIEYQGFDNYNDLIAAVDLENVDVAFPVAGGPYYSEENGIYQTNPLLSSSTDLIYKNVVIYPNNATFAINNNNQMQYYYVKTNYPNAEMVFYDSIEECLDAVLKGEVECTTVNGMRANAILKNGVYSELSLRQLSTEDARCIGVRIGDEGLLRLLNRGIRIIGNDYTENQAYKYIDGLYSEEKVVDYRHYIRLFAVISLFILGLLIVWLITRLKNYRQLTEELQKANNSKTEFIENLAINLRQPLSDLAEDTDSLVAKKLIGTVDNLIDLNNFDTGRVQLKEDSINLINLLARLEDEIKEISSEKNINVQFIKNDVKNKYFITDAARLTQVLSSILEDAIKYSSKGGQISFVVDEERCSNPSITKMVFTIKDDGKSMTQELKNHVLDVYTKAEEGTCSIALTIAKKIVDLMGGEIEILSAKEKGSACIVKVPVKVNYGIR